jgi:hypothetical protein
MFTTAGRAACTAFTKAVRRSSEAASPGGRTPDAATNNRLATANKGIVLPAGRATAQAWRMG